LLTYRGIGALFILAIGITVAVVIEAVVADLSHRLAARGENAGRISAIDDQVAVIVDAVIADLRLTVLTRGRGCTVGVGAIGLTVAVVVEAVTADLGRTGRDAGARKNALATRIGAVHQEVAIVVAAVEAILEVVEALALLFGGAVGVITIEGAIAVFVEAVEAGARLGRSAAAGRRPNTLRVEAIDDLVAVVVLAVVAIFGHRGATAVGHVEAGRVEAIFYAVAVVVRTVEAVLRLNGRDLVIEVIAIGAAAGSCNEAVLIVVAFGEVALTVVAEVGGARVEVLAFGGDDAAGPAADRPTTNRAAAWPRATTHGAAARTRSRTTAARPIGPTTASAVFTHRKIERSAAARGGHPEYKQP